MLGAHADHFMLAQMRERVTAITPNAGGQSLQVPDRERPGSAHVTVKNGYGMPGPQRTVSSAYIPGMGGVAAPPPAPSPRSMLPGMGENAMLPGMGYHAMLPGMGGSSMMPGMGEDAAPTAAAAAPAAAPVAAPGMSSKMKMGLAVAAALGLYMVLKK